MAQPRLVPPADPAERLLGASPAIVALRTQLHHLAAFDTVGSAAVPTVLLQGETGTGKGLVARLLHDSGPRARGHFVEVNCAAIPDHLLEAELFGVVAGAYTDAKRTKPGLFEVASGGTLFLDEVDALPLALQGKLLTAIEAKRVRSVGGVTEHPVDIKLTAATQTDLRTLAAQGRFRPDLYYRLAAIPLVVPPLRARGEDVVLLAEHYLRWYAETHGVHAKRLTRAAEAWLRAYRWPGNVRELAHLMERVTLLHPEAVVETQALEQLGLPELPPAAETAAPPPDDHAAVDELAQIRQALDETQGNVAQAARQLGWTRKQLRYRMRRHGIEMAPRPRGRPSRAAPREERSALTPPGEVPALIPSAEQKPVAILAVELTFPEASGAIPVYEPWTAARRWTQAIVEKVRGFGGALVQEGPTLLLVAFGVPHTLEQLPQRAVQAALALRQLAAEGQVPGPGVRQAVHWGPALVDRQAREPAQTLLPLGDTLGLPVRLLGQAGPGEIVLSPTLARLVVGWCALEALPPPAGEGDPVQVTAYRALGLVPPRSPLAGLRAQALSPFVGRERELTTLQALLAEVERGRGQAVGVVGEPGVGKSRLLLEFRRRLADHRVTYLEGRCLAYGSATPYLPVLDLLRDDCGLAESDPPGQVAEKVRLALEEVGLDAEAHAPYLLHLLGVSEGTERLAGVSPEALRQRTIETLWQLSLLGSRRRPLILAVEDLQWVDPSSEAFFAMVAERLAEAPILFLATYRPGYRPPWLERSYATQLALSPLAPTDSQSVVQAVWQAVPLPEPVAQAILARAEGNPLFLEELTRAVLEEGAAPAARAVPETLQGVLLARIDRLPADAKRTLQLAAVVGRDCPLPLLEALWEGPPAALPPALARLVEAELLYPQGVPSEAGYRFKHALIHEAAYQTLPGSMRQQAHQQVAWVLKGRLSEIEAQPERLAYHYTEAGLWTEAVLYWRKAGQRAFKRWANREAVTCFEQALMVLQHLPESRNRTEQAIDLRLDLRKALVVLGELERIREHLREAEALTETVDDPRRRCRVASYMTHDFWSMGDQDRAIASGQRALADAVALADFALQVLPNDLLGRAYHAVGDYHRAIDFFERNATSLTGGLLYEHFGSNYLPSVGSRANLAWCLAERGEFAEGFARGEEGVRIAEAVDHPNTRSIAYFAVGLLYLRKGDFQRAILRLERALECCQVGNMLFRFPSIASTLGSAYALSGRMAEALPLLELAVEQGASMRLMVRHSLWVTGLSEAYLLAGRMDEALALAVHALKLSRDHKERGHQAYALRLLGEITLQHDSPEFKQAEASYRQALALAEELGMRPLMARCRLGLAALFHRMGRLEKVRSELSAAIEMYRAMEMSYWLAQAEAMLAQAK